MIIGLLHMIYGDERPHESSCLILDNTYEFCMSFTCLKSVWNNLWEFSRQGPWPHECHHYLDGGNYMIHPQTVVSGWCQLLWDCTCSEAGHSMMPGTSVLFIGTKLLLWWVMQIPHYYAKLEITDKLSDRSASCQLKIKQVMTHFLLSGISKQVKFTSQT